MLIKFSNKKNYYNVMEIRDNDKICIFAPLSKTLDKRVSSRLFSYIRKDERKIAIDLTHVQDCTIDFVEQLRAICETKNIGVFNIPSNLFVIINMMNLDKKVKIFVNELDFNDDVRQIVNRKFSLV